MDNLIGMKVGVAGALALLVLCACALVPTSIPDGVSVGPSAAPLPAPPVRGNDAAPVIVASHFSSLDLTRPSQWSGEFITSTNVASLEVRSNLFSINVPRKAFGRFAFTLDVLDVPPIFIRSYRLEIIARNSAGEETELDLPLRIR